jgi:hypothetical protein
MITFRFAPEALIFAACDWAPVVVATPVAPKPWLPGFTVGFTQLHLLYEKEQHRPLAGYRLQFSFFIERAKWALEAVDAKIEVFDDEWPRF